MKERIRNLKLIKQRKTIPPHFLVSSEFQLKKLKRNWKKLFLPGRKDCGEKKKKKKKKFFFSRFGRNWRTQSVMINKYQQNFLIQIGMIGLNSGGGGGEIS